MEFFNNIITERKVIQKNFDGDHKKIIHIAFGIDANFALGMGVLMTSIILNNKNKQICFHVFTDALYQEDLDKLYELVELNNNTQICIYYLDKEAFAQLPTCFIWSHATYYRFIIGEELFGKVDKIIYLDSDVLCLKAIDGLLNLNFEDKIIMGVPDLPGMKEYAIQKLDFHGEHYFNAGVLYIDINKWKKEKIAEKAIELLSKKNNYKFLDQDALNVLLIDKVLFVDKNYNCMYHLADMKTDISPNTVFVHFSGGTKPWQRWSEGHFLVPLWMGYKEKSPWKDTPIVEATSYKQAKYMAKAFQRKGCYDKFLVWYIKYSLWKIKEKLGL